MAGLRKRVSGGKFTLDPTPRGRRLGRTYYRKCHCKENFQKQASAALRNKLLNKMPVSK